MSSLSLNRRPLLLAALLTLVLLFVSCSLPGTPPDSACDAEGALFQDSFDNRSCGWVEYSREGAVFAIEDGALNLRTSLPGQVWWTNPGRNFDDLIVTVLAQQVSGPDNNAFGIICRYQSETNFYLFLISGDGFYAIGKYVTGNDQPIYLTGSEPFVFSDVINQGAATNQIRVGCVGNQLSLAVNGLPLVTIVDDTFTSGDIGLAASTFEAATAEIRFDDIVVIAP